MRHDCYQVTPVRPVVGRGRRLFIREPGKTRRRARASLRHLCVGEVPPVGWSSEYRELDLKTIRLVRSLVPKYRGAKYRDARWTGHPGLWLNPPRTNLREVGSRGFPPVGRLEPVSHRSVVKRLCRWRGVSSYGKRATVGRRVRNGGVGSGFTVSITTAHSFLVQCVAAFHDPKLDGARVESGRRLAMMTVVAGSWYHPNTRPGRE